MCAHRWSAVRPSQRGSNSSKFYWIILRLWSSSRRDRSEMVGYGTSGWNSTVATAEVNMQEGVIMLIISYWDVQVKHHLIQCLHFAVAGALHSDPEALRLAQAIARTDGVELTGVYVHCGNTYDCRGVEQIQAVAQETTNLTLQFMEKYDTQCISRSQACHI